MLHYLKILLATWILADIFAGTVSADIVVRGKLVDDKSGEPVSYAAVGIIKGDSTLVGGGLADSLGIFRLTVQKPGKYLVKTSLIGYADGSFPTLITNKQDSVDLGVQQMKLLDQRLNAVEVKAYAAKVQMRGDTMVFNASAYRLQPGSMLESLIRRLPGVMVDQDGSIKVNGKAVSEIKINGRDFFKGNTSTAMKNLPADLVSDVKSYEEESRENKHMGIKEAEKKTVIDVTLKKELKSTLIADGHTNLAPQKRYDQSLMLNDFSDRWNFSVFNNMKNSPGDNSFDAPSGLTAEKELGYSISWKNKDKDDAPGKVEVSTSGNYSFNDDDTRTSSNSETFLTSSTAKSYANSLESSRNKDRNLSSEWSVFWTPDTMNYISLNMGFSHSKGTRGSNSISAKFNSDPYERADNIDMSQFNGSDWKDILVNTNRSQNKGRTTQDNFHTSFFVAHRFDSIGRTAAAWVNYDISKSHSDQFSINNINYYQLQDSTPQSFYDQYYTSPSRPYSISTHLYYALPLEKDKKIIYFGHEFSHSFSDQNRNWYQLDSLKNITAENYPEIGWLPAADSLELVRNMQNSQYSKYYKNDNTFVFGSNLKWQAFRLDLSLRWKMEHNKLNYQQGNYSTSQSRTFNSLTPSLYGEYKIKEQRFLRFNYNGHSDAPDLLNLVDIPDESNPLYVTKGNKDLKNSWWHSANVRFSDFNSKSQQAYTLSANFTQSFNSISNKLTYDELTGKQISQPQNINGDWNANIRFDFSRSFGKDNMWTLQASSDNQYRHNVGYASTGSGTSLANEKNVMRTLDFNETLRGQYRTENFDAGLSTNFIASNSHSKVGAYTRLNTTTTIIQSNFHWQTPWKMDISTDCGVRLRRGYSESEMNTTEWLWNTSITQSFLQKKNLTIGLKANDILHQRKNFSRFISASGRSEISSNHVGRYVMFVLLYKFNILKNSQK